MAKMMNERDYATPFHMLHSAMLLGQKSRLDKFNQAIRQIVKPNDYVVDIGTGSGILAIMAAKAGAERVSAIDINQESLDYARKAAALNGVADKIEFIKGHFSDFIPTERADVVICEMLSSILLIEQQVPASLHAVDKILKPEGFIIPQKVTIYTVPVESSVMAERFSFEQLRFPSVVQTVSSEAARDLADIQVLDEFDLTNPPSDFSVDKQLTFHIVNNGIIHGLAGFFESVIFKDIKLYMEDGWKQLFIPIKKPVKTKMGDEFKFRVVYTPGEYNSLYVEML